MENLNFNEELSNFPSQKQSDQKAIHDKLEELAFLLADTTLDGDTIKELQEKFNTALRSASKSSELQLYDRAGDKNGMSDGMDQLLFINKLDKRTQKKTSVIRIISLVVKLIVSLLLILLGFGMIIMPAPPYFEMFTLFYLNPDDGVTIMDVISLIVAFIGVYILISSLTKRNR